MIDPAILRPGRLDVKIKIERPDAEAARDIFSKYLPPTCRCTPTTWPSTAARATATVEAMIQRGRRADVHRDRGEPVPRGHLRQRRQGSPLLQGLQLRRDDPEHRRPGQEDGDQGVPRAPARRACGSRTCSRPASTSSRRTRTCPTPPTPTTGPGSPARRASGSSTSARWSPARGHRGRAGRSTRWPTPASTCDGRAPRPRACPGRGAGVPWPRLACPRGIGC